MGGVKTRAHGYEIKGSGLRTGTRQRKGRMIKQHDIREVLLKVIQNKQPKTTNDASLQQNSVLDETGRRLGGVPDQTKEQAILTTWHDLFRTGYLAWGLNLVNPDPPFFHVTEIGRRTFASLSRDPANPDGYLRHLYSIVTLQPVAKSYLEEGIECYVAGLYKSAAVMVGASTESMILDIRECICKKLTTLGHPIPKGLKDWKFKTTLDGIQSVFDQHKSLFRRELRDEFEAYWSAFAQQIRTARNDAGHPTSVEPVTPDTVHASLLIFPELAKLVDKLKKWIESAML